MGINGRWFDYNTRDVVPREVIEAFCKAFGISPVVLARFFELVYVEAGPGGSDTLACECKECGAPMGGVDPDYAKWIRLSVCWDCKG